MRFALRWSIFIAAEGLLHKLRHDALAVLPTRVTHAICTFEAGDIVRKKAFRIWWIGKSVFQMFIAAKP